MVRAERLLERTHYDDERSGAARMIARDVLGLAATLDGTRATLEAAKAERDRFMKLAGYSR